MIGLVDAMFAMILGLGRHGYCRGGEQGDDKKVTHHFCPELGFVLRRLVLLSR